MNLSIYLGILAGILQIVGYFLYTKEVLASRVKPNTASWAIWAYGNILVTLSYITVAQDISKEILPIACAISSLVVFGIFLKKGKFQPLDRIDKIVFGFDIILTVAWWLLSDIKIFPTPDLNILIHILFITSTIASFVPIIRELKEHPSIEKPGPWLVWSLAYSMLGVAVILDWIGWEAFIYPSVYFVLHFLVAIMCEDFQYHKKLMKNFKSI